MPLGGLITGGLLAGGLGASGLGIAGGAALGAGAGALGLFGGGGGQNRNTSITANPIVMDLLGTKIITHGHGADAGTTQIIKNKSNPGVFGGPEFQNAIQNLAFNTPGLFGGEQDVVNSLLSSGGTTGALNKALGDLSSLQGQSGALFGQAGGFAGNGRPVSVSSALTSSGFPAQVDPRLLDTGFGAHLNQDFLNTGFAVDGTPLYGLANDNFIRNSLPAIAERVGATGGGLQSQGFIDTAGREAANLQDAAAAANIALRESAAGRRSNANLAQGQLDDAAGGRRTQGFLEQARLQDAAAARRTQGLLLNAQLADNGQNRALSALGLQSNLIGQQAGLVGQQAALPFAFANDIFGLGNQARSVVNQQNAAPLNTFLALNGAQGPFIQSGFNPNGSGTADLLGSLGGLAPLLKQLLGQVA